MGSLVFGLFQIAAGMVILVSIGLGLDWMTPWLAYPIIIGFFLWLIAWAVREERKDDANRHM